MDRLAASASDNFCVFHCAEKWFGVPALSVRELSPRPNLVAVPRTHPVLVGLCHVRNEFLPMVSCRILMGEGVPSVGDERQMLVIETASTHWGLLVDKVTGLESLEVTFDLDANFSEHASTATQGWATYKEHAVRVLDPAGLFRQAHAILLQAWREQTDVLEEDKYFAMSAEPSCSS